MQKLDSWFPGFVIMGRQRYGLEESQDPTIGIVMVNSAVPVGHIRRRIALRLVAPLPGVRGSLPLLPMCREGHRVIPQGLQARRTPKESRPSFRQLALAPEGVGGCLGPEPAGVDELPRRFHGLSQRARRCRCLVCQPAPGLAARRCSRPTSE